MILDCPRCGVKRVATSLLFGGPDDQAHDPQGTQWQVQRCQSCGLLILLVLDTVNAGEGNRTWPAGSYELDEALTIEPALRDDYREAGLCSDAGCYKASLVMSRRALQRVLKEQGCTQRNLGGNDGAIAHAIKTGILRKALHAIAEEIRQYGNLGAHPDDEQLDVASKESASQVLAFVHLVIDEFYGVPMTAEKLRRNRARA